MANPYFLSSKSSYQFIFMQKSVVSYIEKSLVYNNICMTRHSIMILTAWKVRGYPEEQIAYEHY